MTTATHAADCSLVPVPVQHIQATLPMLMDRLEAVAERSAGRWSVETILQKFITREWDLVLIWNEATHEVKAVMATHLHRTPTGMIILQVPFLTGEDSKDWIGLIKQVEQHALRNGASKVEMWARKGWAKRLPDYTLSHVLLERDLKSEMH